MTDLSIIVPVYQVERYIRPCIESIFKQGLDDSRFEVIIVNDGTKDRSIEVISDIISQHNNITVINQENQGLSVARNNGMSVSKGEYILMIDSDDLLVEDSIPRLLEIALEKKPDLIKADFIRIEGDDTEKLNYRTMPENIELQEKSGQNIFIEELNPYECYIWQTLYKRSFLVKYHISFIPNIHFEDIPFTHECYLKADTYIRAHLPMYLYRKRSGSIMRTIDKEKCFDYCKAIRRLWEFKSANSLSCQTLYQLDQNIFQLFNHLFHIFVYCIHNARDREQICNMLLKSIPNLSFTHGYRQRFISFCYKLFPYFYAHIRYYYGRIVYCHLQPYIVRK